MSRFKVVTFAGVIAVLGAVFCLHFISKDLFLLVLRFRVHEIHHGPVLVLDNGWMFHKEEYDYCFDSLPRENEDYIVRFSRRLASRHIRLRHLFWL